MLVAHFAAIICIAQGSDDMIRLASLKEHNRESDYKYMRHATDLCLAASFCCLLVNLWGIVTARSLRYGLMNIIQGAGDAVSTVLLVIFWQANTHVARVWHVFYIFSLVPTICELAVLTYSYRRGIDVFY